MKARRIKEPLVPISATLPSVAYKRIKDEARRRKVSIGRVFRELIEALPSGYRGGRDMRLEKDGFSYQNVNWDDEAEAYGVIIAEFAMQQLPPSRRELQ
jgi:hypothetical protein